MNGSGLSQAQLARARSHSYRLFGELFLYGVTAVSLPYIQQIPELTAVLPQPFDADAAAANHHELFQFNIFAYESFFLGDDGLVGGEKTAVVQQQYQQRGYTPSGSQADHLGEELSFLAYLAGAEADAWQIGQPENAAQIQTFQQTFLQNHLLRWLPVCTLAIQRQTDSLFGKLAELTQALVLAHFEGFVDTAVSSLSSFLPPTQNILADDKTGFKEIARFLLLPAFSGVYLSREDVGQLGRQFDLPRGFGSREMMLLKLLRTAVQYDALPQLLTALQETCRDWQTSYQQLTNAHPQAASFIHPWQERAAATEQMVTELMVSSIAE